MTIELSACDASFRKVSHETALRIIADLGIRAVDLCVFAGYEHVTPAEVVADPATAADCVRRRVGNVGLRVADVFAILGTSFDDLATNHPDAMIRSEARRQFLQVLEFAARVEAPGLTLLPGVPWPDESAATSRSRAAEELQWRADQAAGRGLRLSIEPHYESIVPTPETARQLLDHAPGVGITLDYSHFVFQSIAQEAVDLLIPRTRHVHGRQAAKGMMQAGQRLGTIDFPRIFRALQSEHYNGYFALEYSWEEWLNCDNVDCISESALLRDVFRSSVRKGDESGDKQ